MDNVIVFIIFHFSSPLFRGGMPCNKHYGYLSSDAFLWRQLPSPLRFRWGETHKNLEFLFNDMELRTNRLAGCLIESTFNLRRIVSTRLRFRVSSHYGNYLNQWACRSGPFNKALRPRRFILLSACNFSADQPLTYYPAVLRALGL